ncbi:MAG: peptidoglycan DD-metalloendopeptidase family protein [Actinomycetota bacterium]
MSIATAPTRKRLRRRRGRPVAPGGLRRLVAPIVAVLTAVVIVEPAAATVEPAPTPAEAVAPTPDEAPAPQSDPAAVPDAPAGVDPAITPEPEPAAAPEAAPPSVGSAPEGTAVPEDPLRNEAPAEAPPEEQMEIPPVEDGTEDLREPARILWSNVAQAERKLDGLTDERDQTISAVRTLRKRHKELQLERLALDASTAAAIAELADATDRARTRAVFGYQQFGSGSASEESANFADYQQVLELQRQSRMVDAALSVDHRDLARLADLQGRLGSDARALLDRIRVVSDHLLQTERTVGELDAAIDEAAIEAEAFRAGSQIFIHGVRFPVAPGYESPLIDSWGFPRMVGTPDEHGHEGIDIFAPRGTPLVAAERGVIARVGTGRLGGLKFWLHGESGTAWYYAHLDSFGPGLADGLVVEAGDLLGFVGDTGNAVGTPPHLHLQLHPGGGDPVNPYPLLRVVADLDQRRAETGTFEGYDYRPVVVERPDPPPTTSTTTSTTTNVAAAEPAEEPATDVTSDSAPTEPPAATEQTPDATVAPAPALVTEPPTDPDPPVPPPEASADPPAGGGAAFDGQPPGEDQAGP